MRGKAVGRPSFGFCLLCGFAAVLAACGEGGQPLLGLADEAFRCRSLPRGDGETLAPPVGLGTG